MFSWSKFMSVGCSKFVTLCSLASETSQVEKFLPSLAYNWDTSAMQTQGSNTSNTPTDSLLHEIQLGVAHVQKDEFDWCDTTVKGRKELERLWKQQLTNGHIRVIAATSSPPLVCPCSMQRQFPLNSNWGFATCIFVRVGTKKGRKGILFSSGTVHSSSVLDVLAMYINNKDTNILRVRRVDTETS